MDSEYLQNMYNLLWIYKVCFLQFEAYRIFMAHRNLLYYNLQSISNFNGIIGLVQTTIILSKY